MTCRLVNNVFKHCKEKLKSQSHKAKEVGDNNKSDEDDEEAHKDTQESSTMYTSGESLSLHDNKKVEEGTYMVLSMPILINQLHGDATTTMIFFMGKVYLWLST